MTTSTADSSPLRAMIARAKAWVPGLSTRLLILTVMFVLLAEAMIFLPSAANFRTNWLKERVEAGQIAVLAVEAAPMRKVSAELSRRLLENAQVVSVATASENGRELILRPSMPISGDVVMFDLRDQSTLDAIGDTIATLFAPDGRFLRLIDMPKFDGAFIEVVVPEAPLKSDLIAYCNRILGLSLLISAVTAALVYLTLVFLVVRPIRRITRSVERFRDDPKDWKRQLAPSGRRDEIGRAEDALADMEEAVKTAFRERERLAQLGEAMAKINHDLRNSLSAAQLVSDGLAKSEDPRVQRAAPRLERALQRGIKLAQETLNFGKSEPAPPNTQTVVLHDVLEEAAMEGLSAHPGVVWVNACDKALCVAADPDHLHRIIVNLSRNAAEALGEQSDRVGQGHIQAQVTKTDEAVEIELADDGPGIPERRTEHLFKPFGGSATRGGSGLGLAIAKELATGMGGDLVLSRTGPDGTAFCLTIPHRPQS